MGLVPRDNLSPLVSEEILRWHVAIFRALDLGGCILILFTANISINEMAFEHRDHTAIKGRWWQPTFKTAPGTALTPT